MPSREYGAMAKVWDERLPGLERFAIVRRFLRLRDGGMAAADRASVDAVRAECLTSTPSLRDRWHSAVRDLHSLVVDSWLPSEPWVTAVGLVLGAALLQGAKFLDDTFDPNVGMAVPAAPMVVIYGVGLVALAASALGIFRRAKFTMVRVALVALGLSVVADGALLPTTVRYADHSQTQAISLAVAGVIYAATMGWLALSLYRVVRRGEPDLDRLVSPLVAVAVADVGWAVAEVVGGDLISAVGSVLSGLAVMALSAVASSVEVGAGPDDGDVYQDIRPRRPEHL
jgi:hypothetical protein